MSGFLIRARELRTGRFIELGDIVTLECVAELASPAVGLRAVAVVDTYCGALGEVALYHDGRLLLSGRVDSQRFRVSGGGTLLELEARDAGALLLDNEAAPRMLAGAGMAAVFSILAQPYGFTLYNPNTPRAMEQFVIGKGMSEWEALVQFSQQLYGITPMVRGMQIEMRKPDLRDILKIGDGGVAFSALEHAVRPYHVVSRVIIRDADGRYSAGVNNASAGYLGVQRKRYLVPQSEFSGQGAADANRVISRSMLQKDLTVATLPGIVDVVCGQQASVRYGGLALSGLLVDRVRWLVGSGGIFTEVGMVNGVYY